MLAPKKVKFRKWQKGRLRGLASRGASIAFGDIGLKAVQHGQLSSQQIEAARIAMMRHIKRGGKVCIRVFRWAGALRSSPAACCTKSRASALTWLARL